MRIVNLVQSNGLLARKCMDLHPTAFTLARHENQSLHPLLHNRVSPLGHKGPQRQDSCRFVVPRTTRLSYFLNHLKQPSAECG